MGSNPIPSARPSQKFKYFRCFKSSVMVCLTISSLISELTEDSKSGGSVIKEDGLGGRIAPWDKRGGARWV
ncbi:MAG TPA: hypothetical protein VLB11_12285, partial [Methyloceanibacter sp.]|nr:hypothetical protein [Methyloceanibacter sp.]